MNPGSGLARRASVLLFLIGCARPAPPAASATAGIPVGAEEEAYVLLWTDARIHRTRDDERPARAYDYGDTPRAARAGEVYVARLLADHGEWIEIRTGPIDWLGDDSRSQHCAGTDLVDGVALDLWVRRDDLAPVLTRPFEQTFGDGTFVRLSPGTPVVDGRPWVDGFSLPVQLPDEAVGIRYEPQPYPAPPASDRFTHLGVSRMAARLDGREVTWSQPPWDYNDPPSFDVDVPGARIAASHSGCGEIELAFEGEVVALPDVGIGGMWGGEEAGAPPLVIPQDAPLSWPDGTPAGTVLETLHLQVAPSPQGVADRRDGGACFPVPLGLEWKSPGYQSAALEVCAPLDTTRAE